MGHTSTALICCHVNYHNLWYGHQEWVLDGPYFHCPDMLPCKLPQPVVWPLGVRGFEGHPDLLPSKPQNINNSQDLINRLKLAASYQSRHVSFVFLSILKADDVILY